jgi:hypothetical protein
VVAREFERAVDVLDARHALLDQSDRFHDEREVQARTRESRHVPDDERRAVEALDEVHCALACGFGGLVRHDHLDDGRFRRADEVEADRAAGFPEAGGHARD